MLGVVVQQSLREREHPQHALVGDPVVDGAVLTPCLDEAAPTKTSQMIRDLRLWQLEPRRAGSERHLAHIGKK